MKEARRLKKCMSFFVPFHILGESPLLHLQGASLAQPHGHSISSVSLYLFVLCLHHLALGVSNNALFALGYHSLLLSSNRTSARGGAFRDVQKIDGHGSSQNIFKKQIPDGK